MLESGNFVMPIAIAIITLGIGMNLKFKDFTRVFTHPKAILTGLGCQLLLLPLIAFGIIFFWPIDSVFKVGFILIASVPGGTASNLVTYLLKGRTALSVSLTSFNSFAIIFTIPLFVSLALKLFLGENEEISLSFLDSFKEIFFTVIIPVVLGILINEYSPKGFTDSLRKPFSILMPVLLFGIMAFALFSENGGNAKSILSDYNLIFPLLLLNILGMLVGFYMGKFMGIRHDGNFTIAIEMGLQNSALAIFIASSILQSKEMEIMAVIYGGFSFFTTIFMGWIFKKYLAPEKKKTVGQSKVG